MIWYTANNYRVSLQCEFLHASSSCLLVQMIWYTVNNCKVSLRCEFLHAFLNQLHIKMIWDTANSKKVSLQFELSNAASSGLNTQMIHSKQLNSISPVWILTCSLSCLLMQMIWYTVNNCEVSLQCEFLHESSISLLLQMIWYTENNCRVSLQCEFSLTCDFKSPLYANDLGHCKQL